MWIELNWKEVYLHSSVWNTDCNDTIAITKHDIQIIGYVLAEMGMINGSNSNRVLKVLCLVQELINVLVKDPLNIPIIGIEIWVLAELTLFYEV